MLQAKSTSDVPLASLRELAKRLDGEILLGVDDRQFGYKSTDPPSWILFVADAPWWLQALAAYAALYVAELTKEGAKATWRAVAGSVSKEESDPVSLLADEISRLRQALDEATRVEIGLPVPNEYWATRLAILGGQEEKVVAAEISLFVHHLPALVEMTEDLGLAERAITGIFLELRDNGDLSVSWIDRELLEKQNAVIPVGVPGGES